MLYLRAELRGEVHAGGLLPGLLPGRGLAAGATVEASYPLTSTTGHFTVGWTIYASNLSEPKAGELEIMIGLRSPYYAA